MLANVAGPRMVPLEYLLDGEKIELRLSTISNYLYQESMVIRLLYNDIKTDGLAFRRWGRELGNDESLYDSEEWSPPLLRSGVFR